ncbi:MAG TPA: hypothetical protein VF455_05130 [Chryseobacterium sp.]
MKSKKRIVFFIFCALPIFGYAQKKYFGIYKSCDSLSESLTEKFTIYQYKDKFSYCSTSGFKSVTIDTLLNGKPEKVNKFVPCDTCDIECGTGSFLIKKQGPYIKASYFDVFNKMMAAYNLYPLQKNKWAKYYGLFSKPVDNRFEEQGKIIYLKDTIITSINGKHDKCLLFLIEPKRIQHQTVFKLKVFVSTNFFLPMRIERYDKFDRLTECLELQ